MRGNTKLEMLRTFEHSRLAVLAQRLKVRSPSPTASLDEEMAVLRKEFTNRWSQTRLDVSVIVLLPRRAAVQGMGPSLNLPSCKGEMLKMQR